MNVMEGTQEKEIEIKKIIAMLIELDMTMVSGKYRH